MSFIAENRRARFEYHLEEEYEAGMVLEGWEVKAVREGKVQLTDGYVVIRDGELFIIGCLINPLKTASTHVRPDAVRTKKLLLKKAFAHELPPTIAQRPKQPYRAPDSASFFRAGRPLPWSGCRDRALARRSTR